MHKAIVAAVTVLLLSGCVTPTAPVSMGNDRYMIGVNARGGFSSNSELLAATVQRAQAFCSSMNKQAIVDDTNTSGSQGWTPQDAQVVFRCVDPSERP